MPLLVEYSLNEESIQDTINYGRVTIYNKSTTSSVTFAPTTSSYEAGIVTAYDAGVVVGGITATITSGTSRVFDTLIVEILLVFLITLLEVVELLRNH